MTASGPADALTLRVRQVRYEGIGIHSYELVDPDGAELPPFEAGAHIDVHVAPGLIRQYSLCNDPSERHRYLIAVLRDERGRGGSRAVHERLQVPQLVKISLPRNNFRLATARRVILLAGGIGITPLKAIAHELDRAGTDYELHYCARDRQFVAFADELASLGSDRLKLHFDNGDPRNGLDIATLLREQPDGAHVYYCGPSGFMTACAAATAHWAPGSVHFEHFKPPEPAAGSAAALPPGAFTVRLQSTGAEITVGADESIVDAVSRAGVEIETSCQSGLCGTCKSRYLSGEVEHRDCVLDPAEQAEYLTPCISRARGLLVLDR